MAKTQGNVRRRRTVGPRVSLGLITNQAILTPTHNRRLSMKRPVESESIPEEPEVKTTSERSIPDIQPRKHRRVTAESNGLGSFGKIQRKQRRISGNFAMKFETKFKL